ncbi:uncharacterized protein KY384_000167 [Bacidia gigantensis]|uniref:uncharacterized protein n=1 Tax=Bacidia gigantensis TaxID=2732470 RepID=UPI001D046ACE|nr:uncharacterized protein KY384_000167 [Bacidia gigantensis]KAG8526174.1 hypothetical protein KY384_000167 [Bacidia gigantensis]
MAEDISVYGYDRSMLACLDDTQSQGSCPPQSTVFSSNSPVEMKAATQRLLNLPKELRSHILSYLLPTTYLFPERAPIWQRGSLAILRTNRQLHAEGISQIYNSCTMSIKIGFQSTRFRYEWFGHKIREKSNRLWRSESTQEGGWNLWACHTVMPLQSVQWRPMAGLIRRWLLVIKSIDEYDGMVHHSVSKVEPLALGLKAGVEEFCSFLLEVANDSKPNRETTIMVVFKGRKTGTGEERWRNLIVQPLRQRAMDGMMALEIRDLTG